MCPQKRKNILKTNEQRWYALYTKSRAEKKALLALTQIGIETYLPLRKEFKQWCDRKKWIESPIISSYIFVKIFPADFRKVFESKSIVSYVSYKGEAVPIPEREMESMKLMVESKVAFSVEMKDLKKGKNVTITSGPLAGVSGEITDIKGTKKLYLRVKHAGFTLVVNMDEESVLLLNTDS